MNNQNLKAYIDSGLHLIPLQKDKSPLYGWKWKGYIPSYEDLIAEDFAAVGMACGNGIEAIDFDLKYDSTGQLFDSYCKLIESIDPAILKKVVIQSTMNKGFHFVYKCEEISGNKKLARRPATEAELEAEPMDKVRVLIETRGDGGYIAIAPSPGYKLLMGNFTDIRFITVEERDILHSAARSFDMMPVNDPKKNKVELLKKTEWVGGKSPFDDFNERGDVISLLEGIGWEVVGRTGDNVLLKRPGTKNKLSATFHDTKRVFYVFTSSSEFDQNVGYSATGVFAKVLHNDDYSAAAKDLLQQGFGEKGHKVESEPVRGTEKLKIEPGNYISTFESDEEDIQRWRRGEIPLGIPFGFPLLDKYWLFKPADVVIINGHGSVGKTVFMLFLYVALAVQYKFKFAIYSSENKSRSLKIKLMEYYSQMKLKHMSDSEYARARQFVEEHFIFIKTNVLYTSFEILDIFTALHKETPFNAALIDPYNSLVLPSLGYGKSGYIHHVETAGAFRVFTERTGAALWVNMHPFTEAARRRDKDGYSVPPGAADTENGGMWYNRSDEFITCHRIVNHPTKWMYMDVYVRRVKEMETGGAPTEDGSPVSFKLEPGGFKYTEEENSYLSKNIYDTGAPEVGKWMTTEIEASELATDIPF